MKIKEVSELLDVPATSLRYYEKVGLLYPIDKSSSGIRDYNEQDINRIRFIKCMRDADIPVDILKQYMDMYDSEEDTVEARKQLLANQYKSLCERIKYMEQAREILRTKIGMVETKRLDRLLVVEE